MSILRKIVSLLLLMMLTNAAVSCAPRWCIDNIHDSFDIESWGWKVPKHGTLYRYKKGSNFSILEQKNELDFKAEMIPQDPGVKPLLNIRFTGYDDAGFSTKSDYKLILDDKIEYRIYDLGPGDGHHACFLTSGKVNQCDLEYTQGFGIPSGCGEPVK
jgi:hypothetical protein